MNKTEYLREWVKNNPDKVALNRAIAKLKFYLKPEDERKKYFRDRYARKSPEQKKRWVLYHKEWQWRKYGIKDLTIKIFEQTLKKQNNKCKICKEELKIGKNGANADHDHNTGRFRGILCNGCNLAYGRYEKFKKGFKDYDSSL